METAAEFSAIVIRDRPPILTPRYRDEGLSQKAALRGALGAS